MNTTLETHDIPLLKDHHNHLSLYALLLDCPNLQHEQSKANALALLLSLDPARVSVVLGWHSGYYDFTPADLTLLPPVIVVNISLHRFLISPAAETQLRDKYPEIIAHYQDSDWFEAHMPQMLIFLSSQVEPTLERYTAFFDFMVQQGVYYVEEMQLPGDNAYQILQSSPFSSRTGFWTTPEIYSQLNWDTRRGLFGIKLFTDGALGARTAALKLPYTNGTQGGLLYTDAALYKSMRDVSVSEKGLAVHAIGDLATEQVVRVVRQLKTDGYTFPLVRMEHCQFIEEKTAREARDLNLTLSMQPNFNSDSAIYSDRLPAVYLENNNPFRMLIDHIGFTAGLDLILGSDGMPHGAQAALQNSLFPPFPGQQLTLSEFCAAYGMQDNRFGSIRVEVDQQEKTIKLL